MITFAEILKDTSIAGKAVLDIGCGIGGVDLLLAKTYDAALVMIDAIKRVAATGKPVTRESGRDALQASNVPTIQGVVSFDENGDLKDRTVSVFQIQQDKNARPDDVSRQYHYIGVAPQS